MVMYFKIKRTDEEIFQLNVEIPRFLTYMRVEEDFLRQEVERERRVQGDGLAHQVEQYRMREGCFNDEHRFCLLKLARLSGCAASMHLGIAINKDRLQGADEFVPPMMPPTSTTPPPESDSDTLQEFSPDFMGLIVTGGELRVDDGGENDGIDGAVMAR
ncbi:hypothetical protein B0H14DRAFT_2642320 [Mycena olivaceomarginata]|nr:hypothetical protein B0H14DRAFT_2642320 [Mycena olivaceomarginata]